MEQHDIFRKVALERLSSPDRLDVLMRVTTPGSWIALIALSVLIGAALVWSFLGNIPIVANGKGMLLNRGGVINIVTSGSGQISEIVVRVNEFVRRGQVVARIAQPVLTNELQNTRNELEELKTQHQKLVSFSDKDLLYQLESLGAQGSNLQYSIKELEKRIAFVKIQMTKKESLLEKGLVIPAKVEADRQQLNSLTEQLNALHVRLSDLKTQENALRNRTAISIKESEFKINALQRKISLMENRIAFDSRVVSMASGKVVEIKATPGTVVSVGTPVIGLELADKKIEAVLYVSEAEGKKIKPGMMLDIVPSSVRKEESGSILGLVTYVSEYPATYAGMVNAIGNEQLVQELSRNSAPYAVYADLIPDSYTPSGYKWSSGKGPNMQIDSGTMCSGQITMENKKPISLVIPYMKGILGL